MNISIDSQDRQLLEQAIRDNDPKGLKTWKQRFVYQFVHGVHHDHKGIMNIADAARAYLGKPSIAETKRQGKALYTANMSKGFYNNEKPVYGNVVENIDNRGSVMKNYNVKKMRIPELSKKLDEIKEWCRKNNDHPKYPEGLKRIEQIEDEIAYRTS